MKKSSSRARFSVPRIASHSAASRCSVGVSGGAAAAVVLTAWSSRTVSMWPSAFRGIRSTCEITNAADSSVSSPDGSSLSAT